MVPRAPLPLGSLIHRMASVPLPEEEEGNEAFRASLEILLRTVRADAFALLKGSVGEGSYRVFAGKGLLSPEGKTPTIRYSALEGRGTPPGGSGEVLFSLEGPFSDPFLSREKAATVLAACSGPGSGRAGVLAIRRTGESFSPSEKDRFAAVACVLNLRMRCGFAPWAEGSPVVRQAAGDLESFPFFMDALGKEVSRSRRSEGEVTVGILSLGRGLEGAPAEGGDLERVAGVLKSRLRDFDTLVRYSGRELAFILPDASGEEALGVIKRVLADAAGEEGRPFPAVHVGLSSYPRDGATVERLLETAEAALNCAREQGDSAVSRWKG